MTWIYGPIRRCYFALTLVTAGAHCLRAMSVLSSVQFPFLGAAKGGEFPKFAGKRP